MSDHRVEVVPIELLPHPNADTLSVVKVFSGYTCCVRTEDWSGRAIGAYIPPDSIVPEFDVESLRRYAAVFEPGELVYVTEKIHGANGRYVFDGENFHAGSRTEWKRYNEGNLWWKALVTTAGGAEVKRFLIDHPEIAVYCEVYGQVQDLKYGSKPGEACIAVFDLLSGSEWINAQEARDLAPALPWVPTIASGAPFDLEAILALAEGPSKVPGANHLREGIVVKPMTERAAPEVGRVCLKVVSNAYLERA